MLNILCLDHQGRQRAHGSLVTVLTASTPYSAFPLPTRPDRAITTQEADFRAWLRQQQDPNHPMTSEQLKYVASSLCLAQLDIAQLRPLQVFEFDPTWIHPLCEDPPTIQYFYVLPILQFKSRLGFGEDIPPKPRRALNADGRDAIEHIQLVHATSPRGLRGILTEAKLRPSKLHQADSCSFFAIGYRKSFDLQQDRWETARVLNSGWQASKNTARILVLCLGWGDGKTLKKEVKPLVLNILGMEVFATTGGQNFGSVQPVRITSMLWRGSAMPLHQQNHCHKTRAHLSECKKDQFATCFFYVLIRLMSRCFC